MQLVLLIPRGLDLNYSDSSFTYHFAPFMQILNMWITSSFFILHVILLTVHCKGFPGSSAGKESACNAGNTGLILGLKRSLGGGHSNPFQYSCLENPHGQRSLAGYSPRGCRVEHSERLNTVHCKWFLWICGFCFPVFWRDFQFNVSFF